MTTDRYEPDPDTLPCPVCGTVVRSTNVIDDDGSSVVGDPLLATPVARLYALASSADIATFDVSEEDSAGFAGAVAVGFDDEGNAHGMIGLAEDLDDGLRADALAFGIAVVMGDFNRIIEAPDGFLGISRDRLPAANKGSGHLAWHIARTCGRCTSSATFELQSP